MRCTITGNTATQGAFTNGRGGGIFSAGTLTVMDSTITNNSAEATGGGIFGDTGSTATIVRSIVGGNTGIGGSGIFNNQGTLSLSDSTISGNTADNVGGGIYNNKGTLSMTRTTVSGNSATALDGGGIYNNKGPTVSVINSTISGNFANQGLGGGMFNNGSTVTIANTTFMGNSAANSGGGIYLGGTTLNLTNTIIAGSPGGICLNQGGTLATNSHNLIQDGSCGPMLTGDPKLGPLQNNGGLTSTRALLAGSPAIDAGDDSVTGSPLSLGTDQRGTGFPRLSGAHVDIGAFEVQQASNQNFDTCVKDINTGNLFQFSSTTGAYSFTICGQPPVTGTGKVQIIGSTTYLTDFTTPGRKVSAFFNHGQLTGRATVTLSVAPGIYQTTIVNQAMPGNGQCACQ
jgi:predicted outer membrane repeat protein